jgi:hypothetical protein
MNLVRYDAMCHAIQDRPALRSFTMRAIAACSALSVFSEQSQRATGVLGRASSKISDQGDVAIEREREETRMRVQDAARRGRIKLEPDGRLGCLTIFD